MRIYFYLFLFITSMISKGYSQVRGTWVTNVASNALGSRENIAATVARCKAYGLNTLYVVTWNQGLTMYPSPVAERYAGIRQDPVYNGFDPIAEIIMQGHKAGLKVIGWFEYGFAYGYKDTSSVWLKKFPHWAGRNNKGSLLQKNGFYWWNALHPEVQTFMRELLLDFVQRYDADGIQGDDRLPAMPSEGGYDEYTIGLYANEHNGTLPPADTKEHSWVQWRTERLSSFIKGLYQQVKKIKPGCIVSWAPSPYPWSREQYLQDWPSWLKDGYADEVLPQLYRYDINAYEKVLKELSTQFSAAEKKKIFPGILTSLGDGYRISQHLLEQMIQLNRQYGFEGECSFYYEGLSALQPYYPAQNKR